jgi:hypothetical protein
MVTTTDQGWTRESHGATCACDEQALKPNEGSSEMYDDVEPAGDPGRRSFKPVVWMAALWIALVLLAVFPFPWWW